MSKTNLEIIKKIPSVDLILQDSYVKKQEEKDGREKTVQNIREVLVDFRKKILNGDITDEKMISISSIVEQLKEIERKMSNRKLRQTINGTGIVVHTNLGRSPISKKILDDSLKTIENYCNLEFNIETGKRGSRHDHLRDLLVQITGAEDAIVVNNNAAAVLLILSTFSKDKEVIVSRGELVEVGGSFRIPSVMEQSGAKLVEIGATNKTHIHDYENAITPQTSLLMKIHTSNYKILGFTKSVSGFELKDIGERYDIPVVEDLGSGVLIDLRKFGLSYEPTVQDAVKQGIDIISFSGDKLLGGPQAGVIVGKKKYIDMMKKNQLLRALRVDKVIISLLYNTLRTYLNEDNAVSEIPILKMLSEKPETIKERAQGLKNLLDIPEDIADISIEECLSQVGGGSLPNEFMESFALTIKPKSTSVNKLESKLRLGDYNIITRISEDKIFIDLRTIFEKDIEKIASELKKYLN